MIKRKAKRRLKPIISSIKGNGFGYEMPPSQYQVEIYFDQKGMQQQAALFFKHYENLYWQSPFGTRYQNWKVLAAEWIFNNRPKINPANY